MYMYNYVYILYVNRHKKHEGIHVHVRKATFWGGGGGGEGGNPPQDVADSLI